MQSNCGVQFGGEALEFASCQSVTSELGTDMTVHWTVVDAGNGNSTLRGAMNAAQSANAIDWAGFGFNPALEMIGGNALVVKSCTSCSSGKRYSFPREWLRAASLALLSADYSIALGCTYSSQGHSCRAVLPCRRAVLGLARPEIKKATSQA